MNIRVFYNVILVRLGIRQILPSGYVNRMRVVENHDPMVQLPTNENLFYKDGKAFLGRKEMIGRLVEAAKNLSEQGYRHISTRHIVRQKNKPRNGCSCMGN